MKKHVLAGLMSVAALIAGMHGAYAMDPTQRQRLENKLHAEHKAQWGYSGEIGPEHWGELSDKYEMCAKGKNQSPIDLADFTDADLPPIEFSYSSDAKEIVNNGHSVQANYAAGSSISVDGHEYSLLQFHFHSPSENHIKGKSFPMEGHLVHADKDKNLAVVAVMFEEGKASGAMADLWEQMPSKAGDKATLSSSVNALTLLPENRDYYSFNGSLTTPPCSEGVKWMVMKQPVSVSNDQVEAFKRVMGHPNNRPVQPVNARAILE
jgi:carbonic anhydrase